MGHGRPLCAQTLAWLVLAAGACSAIRVTSPPALAGDVYTPVFNYRLGTKVSDSKVDVDFGVTAELLVLGTSCDLYTSTSDAIPEIAGKVALVKRTTNGADSSTAPTWELDRTILQCVLANGGLGVIRYGGLSPIGFVYNHNTYKGRVTNDIPLLEVAEEDVRPLVDFLEGGGTVVVDLVASGNKFVEMLQSGSFAFWMRGVLSVLAAINFFGSFYKTKFSCSGDHVAALVSNVLLIPPALLFLLYLAMGPLYCVQTPINFPMAAMGLGAGFHIALTFLPIMDSGAPLADFVSTILCLIFCLIMGFVLCLVPPLIISTAGWSTGARIGVSTVLLISVFLVGFQQLIIWRYGSPVLAKSVQQASSNKARRLRRDRQWVLRFTIARCVPMVLVVCGAMITFVEAGPKQSPGSFFTEWALILFGISLDMLLSLLARNVEVGRLARAAMLQLTMFVFRETCRQKERDLLAALQSGDAHTALACLSTKLPLAVNKRDAEGATPLWHACSHGLTQVVSALLARDADPDKPNSRGETPLMIAAKNGHSACISALQPNSTSSVLTDHEGNTALMSAVMLANVEAVKALANQSSLAHPNSKGEIPIFAASALGHSKVISALSGSEKSVDSQGRTCLHIAVENKHHECARAILSLPVDKEKTNKSGRTALHLACELGDVEMVRILAQGGCNMQAKINGFTPLQLSFRGDVFSDDVNALLRNHSVVNPIKELECAVGGTLEQCKPELLLEYFHQAVREDKGSWKGEYAQHWLQFSSKTTKASQFQAIHERAFGQALRRHLERWEQKWEVPAASVAVVKEYLDVMVEEARDQTDLLLEVYQQRRNAHRKMYESVMLGVMQEPAFAEFVEAASLVSSLMPAEHPRQTISDIASLYKLSDGLLPTFNAFVSLLGSKSGATVLQAPLKGIFRAIEKTQLLPGKDKGDVALLCDVVRGAVEFANMNNMLMFLQLLASSDPRVAKENIGGMEARAAGVQTEVRMLRVKNRFHQATSGGWRDCMVNFALKASDSQWLVCEVQLVHARMMLVRKQMGAHKQYAEFRTALELLEATGRHDEIQRVEAEEEEKIQQEIQSQNKAPRGSVLGKSSVLDVAGMGGGGGGGGSGGGDDVVGMLMGSVRTMQQQIAATRNEANNDLGDVDKRLVALETFVSDYHRRVAQQRREREQQQQQGGFAGFRF